MGSKRARFDAVNLSNLSGSRITGQVLRSDGYFDARLAIYPITTVLSRMVYICNGASARAIGTLQSSSGSIINQVQTGFVHP